MRVIISHQNIDFDGLASMVACSKLYPDAMMFFTGKLGDEVKKFMALYKNILTIPQAGKLKLEEVKEMFIVDVNSKNRIGKFKDLINTGIPITIYDHHPLTDSSIQDGDQYIKPYGACVTILLEEIIKKNIAITSFEATLMALGIYTDTHCLTLSHTTYHEAEAVAYLLKNGANLTVLNEFLKSPLGPQQDQLLTMLLNHCEVHHINGYQIIISTLEREDFVDELGTMAEKMIALKKCDALFLIVKMENRCYIIGRSQAEEINIPFILKPYGGGGHPKAASASVKDGSLAEIHNQVLEILRLKTKHQITARDIMSYPVKTVFEEMTIHEVNKIMLRYGHTGLPVVKNDTLIGIISRTDVDKAIVHGLGHAPVKGFMSHHVKTVEPNTPVTEINSLLVDYHIGRLPVLKEDRIIGIVTRTDLLKVLHGEHNYPSWYKKTFNSSLGHSSKKINYLDQIQRLPEDIYDILKTAGQIGDELGSKVFVVGGFVRDLLLNRANWDIDIVIEGEGIAFAERLNGSLKGTMKSFEQFNTAMITLANGQTIDIVTARREYYEYPAALPRVEKSSIWSDLFRRDFTINCMAIQLNKPEMGLLVDYFGGLRDLKDKKIRVLYNLSFIEDPTRIFRALRFSTRLDFEIESETTFFMKQAIEDNMIKKLSNDRIREELLHLLGEPKLAENIKRLDDYGILRSLHPSLKLDDHTLKKLAMIDEAIEQFQGLYKSQLNPITLAILILVGSTSYDAVGELINQFTSNQGSASRMEAALKNRDHVYRALKQEEVDRFTLFQLIHPLEANIIVYYYIDCFDPYVRHYLRFYALKLKDIHISISGKDLQAMGIKPGPIYKTILDAVLKEKVLGRLYHRTDELTYAANIYENLKGEGHVSS
ncbi:CBS domain-containing protein [Alkaliphilus crotonatoxidans]